MCNTEVSARLVNGGINLGSAQKMTFFSLEMHLLVCLKGAKRKKERKKEREKH